MTRLWDRRWLIFLVIAAASWRLASLDARSLWFDEAFSWQLTRFGWSEMITRAIQDVHPPLYYVLLKLWTALLGDSVFAMRLLSVAWFLVTLMAASLVCHEAARTPGEKAPTTTPSKPDESGAWAMLLISVSPLVFRYSQEARMYTQEIALVLLSTWLLLRSLRGPNRATWWVAYGLAAAALAYTHNFGLFSLAAEGLFAAGYLLLTSAGERRLPWRHPTLPYVAGAAALAVALFLPWLPMLLRQQAQVSEDYWQAKVDVRSPLDLDVWRSISFEAVAYMQADQVSPSAEHKPLAEWLGYGIMGLVGLTLVLLIRRGDRTSWCLIIGIVGPIELAIIQSFVINRNLLETRYFLPILTLLLTGIGLLIGRIRPMAARWCVGGLVAGGLAFCSLRYQESLDLGNRPEYRGVSDQIARGYEKGDLVVCSHPASYFPMKYHARGRFLARQALYRGLNINHYQGKPILQNEDFLAWNDVTRREQGRVWIVGTKGDIDPLEKPPGWRRLVEYQVPEAIQWRGPIRLELWQIGRSQGAAQ